MYKPTKEKKIEWLEIEKRSEEGLAKHDGKKIWRDQAKFRLAIVKSILEDVRSTSD